MNCFEIGSKDRDAGIICAKLMTDYGGKADELSDAEKVYRRATQVAIDEARWNFKHQPLLNASYPAPYPFLKFLREKGHMTIPFLFGDMDSGRRVGERLLHSLFQKRSLLTRAIDFQRFLTAPDQLGMRFDENAVGSPTPHGLDAVEARKGNCLAFVLLEYGMSLLLGKKMRLYDQVNVPERAHVLVSVGPDFIDPEDGFLHVPPPPSALLEITPMDLIAYYHYNQSLSGFCQKEDPNRNEACEETELLKAQRYSPRNFRVQYALAFFYYHKKRDYAAARVHFTRYQGALKSARTEN